MIIVELSDKERQDDQLVILISYFLIVFQNKCVIKFQVGIVEPRIEVNAYIDQEKALQNLLISTGSQDPVPAEQWMLCHYRKCYAHL